MRNLLLPIVIGAALAASPNIVVIMTDDQDVEMGSLEHMPTLRALLQEQGADFTNMYAAVPVCCPSRSSFYSGRFQHNNHVLGNSIPANCSSVAWQQTMEVDSFAVHLQNAGYATSFAGKYLNCYGAPKAGGVAHVPAGWTNWQGLVGNSVYYDYTLSNNGVAETHGSNYQADYLPDLVLNKTLDFLTAQAGKGPFLAYLSPPACHGPADPAPQYAGDLPGVHAPRTPAFNAKVANTHWLEDVQAVYGLDANSEGFLDLVFRRRLLTLKSVDDMIGAVVAKLSSLGVLDNTYIVYTTDNGYHLGHYGFIYDKRQPWETDTHLPLFISGPGIGKNVSSSALVNMVDVSATLLDMAGVPLPSSFDGASVLPYIKSSSSAPAPALMTLVEYHGETGDGGGPGVCNRTATSDLFCNPDGTYQFPPFWNGSSVCVCQDSANNTYSCLRTKNATLDFRYCEFADAVNTVEYFDYTSDPYELTNLAPGMNAGLKIELSGRLAAATSCVGSTVCQGLLNAPLQMDNAGQHAALPVPARPIDASKGFDARYQASSLAT